ncbi:MAG: alkaline phosphatase family protein [Acidobacteria bacterium]|nr:alkaline phosphatase family protein [Acidobacteriota bacterium]
MISVDQMRADYLERFRDQFTGGLKRLLDKGAIFSNAHHDHAATVTSCGHATLLSGLYPGISGIVSNAWLDPQEKRRVEAVEDNKYPELDAHRRGVSPLRFNGTTLVDWLRATYPTSKVASISGKDRAAVLMVGRAAKDVYWYTPSHGRFTTSKYYQQQLPRRPDPRCS